MGKQIRRTPEQIIRKLRQAEVLSAQGKTVDQISHGLFPGINEEVTNKNLAEIVAHSLQKDFGQYTSTIKTIGQTTGANLRTIRNWHDGLKVPSPLHFIQLLQASASFLHP